MIEYDNEFLKSLFEQTIIEKKVRITLLSYNEQPVRYIEDEITDGTINIDGSSAIRRTCSLSITSESLNMSDFDIDVYNKFKIEIGIVNKINNNYDEIIWFPQGIFVLTSINSSVSQGKKVINISGKDKMCLLNGDLSGSLLSSIDFGGIDSEDENTGSYIYTSIPVKDIILNLINYYGKELKQNIIINDMDMKGLELLNYSGGENSPAYFIINRNNNQQWNLTLNKNMSVSYNGSNYTLDSLSDDNINFNFYIENELSDSSLQPSEATIDNKTCYISKITNSPVGYRETELTYAGDLITKVGESITSVLDKIVKMLGAFEYFYDVNGRFVFQRKKTYTDISWNNVLKIENNIYDNFLSVSKYDYIFNDLNLITQLQNNPDISKIRNDFAIWGEKKTSTGNKIDIHLRYAVQHKPSYYKAINLTEYKLGGNVTEWREILYQMAIDYNAYNQEEDFLIKLAENNPQYENGITGYEQYYTDMLGFWRDIYDGTSYIDNIVEKSPDSLAFWIDFLDYSDESEIAKYAVESIGDRKKSISDSNAGAIYYNEYPDVLFYSADESEPENENNYPTIQINSYTERFFTISNQGKSAWDVLEDNLSSNINCAESLTITCIPIYSIQPNTRILLDDDTYGNKGEYIVNKISVPLKFDGTMSISANKLLAQFY